MSQSRTKRDGTATYSARELSLKLGISLNGVYGGVRRGEIPHLKIGGRIVFPKQAINAWFAGPGCGPSSEVSE